MGKTNKTKRHNRKSKKVKKDRNREKRKESRKLKKPKDDYKNRTKASKESRQSHNDLEDSFAIPVELMNNKSYAPETSEEYKQRQNKVRRELDPISGRLRLIKGDGEVLEEIVSRERHAAINKIATKSDGQYFYDNTVNKLRKS